MTDEEKKEERGTGNEERVTSDEQKSEIKNLQSEIKHGLFHHHCKKCEEYKAGWQRARADYQNLQKEVENMRGEWARYSEQQILEEFLPVYDNFKLAFGLRTTDYSPEQQKWVDGMGFIMKQFWKVMQDHGVEEIKTVGEQFNPELHEAVSEEESDLPEHTIVRELEAGYVMRGKVIKVAKVVVAKQKFEHYLS